MDITDAIMEREIVFKEERIMGQIKDDCDYMNLECSTCRNLSYEMNCGDYVPVCMEGIDIPYTYEECPNWESTRWKKYSV